MCTGRGLEALRALLADWNAGLFGQTILMGVAVTMPLPKTPRELRKGALLVGSAARAVEAALHPRTRPRRLSRNVSARVRQDAQGPRSGWRNGMRKLVDAVHRRGAGDVRPWKAHQQRTSKEK